MNWTVWEDDCTQNEMNSSLKIKPNSPQRNPINLFKISGSPQRRARLRELTIAINSWEDNCNPSRNPISNPVSHHNSDFGDREIEIDPLELSIAERTRLFERTKNGLPAAATMVPPIPASTSPGKRSMGASSKSNYTGTRDLKRFRVNRNEMDSETSIVSSSGFGTNIERRANQNSPLRAEAEKRHRKFRQSSPGRPGATSPLTNAIPSPETGTVQNVKKNLVHTKSVASGPINLTPKTVNVQLEEVNTDEERMYSFEDQIKARIIALEHESQTQQRSMAQASKALSECESTTEFGDSAEYVECQRDLLISTQKNSAIVTEIRRLKAEEGRKSIIDSPSPIMGDFPPSCKGNVTIHDFKIHLKRDFMNNEIIYHFIALVKYQNQLQASALACIESQNQDPSSNAASNFTSSTLDFPNSFKFENLDPDFSITVEVYVLEDRKKVRNRKEKSKMALTKRKKKEDSASTSASKLTHFQNSPVGSDVILASFCKFGQVGSFTIEISRLKQKQSNWEFNKMLKTTCLDKRVSISIKSECSAEGGVGKQGFLNMYQFSDISDSGSWHRQWCKLTPWELSYWKNPEDEPNEPMGKILLRDCVNSKVEPVDRELCVRTNTFLVLTTRSPQEGDKNSFVKFCGDDCTAIRHLISADTKEQRDLWCLQFNKALTNSRAWDPHAKAPNDTVFHVFKSI